MSKKLSEMTLEELWQLFPIILTEPQPQWAEWYTAKAHELRASFPECRVHHIGSTAIHCIWAKPIIDILMEVPAEIALHDCKQVLCQSGWICMAQSEHKLSFNQGYTENGFDERVYHLHLRHAGDHDELYFRDYLNAHPDAAQEYQQLKLNLWKQFEHDRDGYTAAKAEFVQHYTQLAKLEFSNRYE